MTGLMVVWIIFMSMKLMINKNPYYILIRYVEFNIQLNFSNLK